MYHLAIDIGASSGRHILGSVVDGKLQLEEIYRFENGVTNKQGTLVWDIENLIHQVIEGIAVCKKIGKIPKTVAIDTWGVDYVILDKNKNEILPVMSYRDSSCEIAAKEVAQILPQEELYKNTGIQHQVFNTIYQLYRDRKNGKLESAKYFLMIPEYLSYKLTGVIKNEYTNASTTNLVNANTKQWDTDILNKLDIPTDIFKELSLPGTKVGEFLPQIQEKIGFNCEVIFCPSHDTASAVAACPIDEKCVYISSGTWSLIGTENLNPVLDKGALTANFTNEGGIEYRFRFLKNIMGMWLFQNIRKNLEKKYSYDEMMEMAKSSSFCEFIDPTDQSFLAPDNMIEAVRKYLNRPELPLCDVLSSVYHSLANSYKKTVEEIEKISNKQINEIHIVGGGSKDKYLNQLTSKYTGKKVCIGLMEATATGNILSQIMYSNNIDLASARKIVKNTFDIKEI
ncbi:MAG: rhamnulokinase [Ruminococcaceae bacterium]|nr:rhamnulokinase [Oscillospiraceae bacterium]